MANQELNAEGLNCPLPIIKAKKALKGMDVGDVLSIRATDPGSVADFAAFCNQTGNELVAQSQDGDVFTYEIKRA
ncbi:sulfurtransferase TusA family protein [Aliiroseovarius subalbicans]|uniref:sulfurtransferase TusA family protein n=1 Tax=Aliiroseovarius subalbicans TaxID=2925840 RepID=UPI001F5AC644|nr:sulfurtransferase TusA family protein [Aliiroseovarius subalbicans]MCI2400129.1 sulfurtransferase TusA family protein [Aliiroseovarius subalbicans]